MLSNAVTLNDVLKQWVHQIVSTVTPVLERRGRKWCVRIDHEFENEEGVQVYDSNKHTEIVEWAEAQLKTWPQCTRMAYDQWFFDRRQDAEKFRTMCNLKWQ